MCIRKDCNPPCFTEVYQNGIQAGPVHHYHIKPIRDHFVLIGMEETLESSPFIETLV